MLLKQTRPPYNRTGLFPVSNANTPVSNSNTPVSDANTPNARVCSSDPPDDPPHHRRQVHHPRQKLEGGAFKRKRNCWTSLVARAWGPSARRSSESLPPVGIGVPQPRPVSAGQRASARLCTPCSQQRLAAHSCRLYIVLQLFDRDGIIVDGGAPPFFCLLPPPGIAVVTPSGIAAGV